jgi:hypothetical protein
MMNLQKFLIFALLTITALPAFAQEERVFVGRSARLPEGHKNATCSGPTYRDDAFVFIYWAGGKGKEANGLLYSQRMDFTDAGVILLSCQIEGLVANCSLDPQGKVDLTYERGPVTRGSGGPDIRGKIQISDRIISKAGFPLPSRSNCSHNFLRP